jgi:hypothetical protein
VGSASSISLEREHNRSAPSERTRRDDYPAARDPPWTRQDLFGITHYCHWWTQVNSPRVSGYPATVESLRTGSDAAAGRTRASQGALSPCRSDNPYLKGCRSLAKHATRKIIGEVSDKGRGRQDRHPVAISFPPPFSRSPRHPFRSFLGDFGGSIPHRISGTRHPNCDTRNGPRAGGCPRGHEWERG